MPIHLPSSKGARVYFAFALGADRDEDSVIDAQDACRDVAGPWSDVPQECGCPDKDGDGIADLADECPEVRGIREASSRNKRGCPRSYGKVQVTDCGIEIPEQIRFATNRWAIPSDRETRSLLSDIGAAMRDLSEKVQGMVIVGHTDDRGTTDNNMKLSSNRAKAVRDSLVQREKIAAQKLETRGAGPFAPRSPNTTDEGRASNRRVELKIVDAGQCGSGSW